MRNASVTWSSCFLWITLLCVGIYFQYIIQGVDALCIAFIWALHDGRWPRFLWLAPLLILLQEGGGSMDFGTSIIWYACMGAVFLLGRCIFAVESIVFMFLFSLAMGCVYYILLNIMTSLQNIDVANMTIFYTSIWQASCVLVAWILVIIFRQRFIKYAHSV